MRANTRRLKTLLRQHGARNLTVRASGRSGDCKDAVAHVRYSSVPELTNTDSLEQLHEIADAMREVEYCFVDGPYLTGPNAAYYIFKLW